MFYRGKRYMNPMSYSPYLVRGGNSDYHHGNHHGGHNPPPPPDGGGYDGGFFGGGLTSFIFGGIAGALLANVSQKNQWNAEPMAYPVQQPIAVPTPVPYYGAYVPQANQMAYMNQAIPPQGYNQTPSPVASTNQIYVNGQPINSVAQQVPMTNGTVASRPPMLGDAGMVAMPYYMVPIQQKPNF